MVSIPSSSSSVSSALIIPSLSVSNGLSVLFPISSASGSPSPSVSERRGLVPTFSSVLVAIPSLSSSESNASIILSLSVSKGESKFTPISSLSGIPSSSVSFSNGSVPKRASSISLSPSESVSVTATLFGNFNVG